MPIVTVNPTVPPVTTANYNWGNVTQAQMGVSVNALIQLITNPPRPVVEMSLHDWSIVGGAGQQAVQHATGVVMGFHPHKVPPYSPNIHPVIVCEGNGKAVVLDGNHRMASCIQNARPTIKAVIVTEAEARSCINGMHNRFNKALGLPPPPPGAAVKP